jgi:hypothetical protein
MQLRPEVFWEARHDGGYPGSSATMWRKDVGPYGRNRAMPGERLTVLGILRCESSRRLYHRSLPLLNPAGQIWLRALANLKDMSPGSVVGAVFRCGKASCHGARPEYPGHGPNLRLTYKWHGKTVTEALPTPAAVRKAERDSAIGPPSGSSMYFQNHRDNHTSSPSAISKSRTQQSTEPSTEP